MLVGVHKSQIIYKTKLEKENYLCPNNRSDPQYGIQTAAQFPCNRSQSFDN